MSFNVKIFWIDGVVTETERTYNPKEAIDFATNKVAHDIRVIRRVEVHDLEGCLHTIYQMGEAA